LAAVDPGTYRIEETLMDKMLSWIGLKREAVLLDSWLYILKSMVAISIGFLLGRAFSITRLDMVSVLLGVMYNLEAVNVSGLKGGINQMAASAMAALTTGILVYLMAYNISFLTIALGMGLTIFIALKINYRLVSPVAIFTSVYMTQLLQSDSAGHPDVVQTFLVRIAALGLGILIALGVNFLFSIVYYRGIGKKRLEFVKIQSLVGLRTTYNVLASHSDYPHAQSVLARVFSDIEMVKANLETMMKEKKLPFNRKEKANLDILYEMVKGIKNLIHLAFDCAFLNETFKTTLGMEDLGRLKRIIDLTESMEITKKHPVSIDRIKVDQSESARFRSDVDCRMKNNLDLMESQYNRLADLYDTLH
jgi:hypothetical protein